MLIRYVLLSVALFGAALFVFPNPTQAATLPANPAINIVAQAATPAPTVTPSPPPTATPAPTPTPVVLPTSTSTASSSSSSGLPVIPIFLGIIFLGLIFAAVVPFLRSRNRR